MNNPPADLEYLVDILPLLEGYLIQPAVFLPAPFHPGWPTSQISIGNVLLSLRRVETAQEPLTVDHRVDSIASTLGMIRTRWRTHWQNKLAAEYAARLRIWEHFLVEFLAEYGERAGYFQTGVRNRVILELIEMDGVVVPDPLHGMLSLLDVRLKAASQPGGFIWLDEMQAGFPEDRFWFLYRTFSKGG